MQYFRARYFRVRYFSQRSFAGGNVIVEALKEFVIILRRRRR